MIFSGWFLWILKNWWSTGFNNLQKPFQTYFFFSSKFRLFYFLEVYIKIQKKIFWSPVYLILFIIFWLNLKISILLEIYYSILKTSNYEYKYGHKNDKSLTHSFWKEKHNLYFFQGILFNTQYFFVKQRTIPPSQFLSLPPQIAFLQISLL